VALQFFPTLHLNCGAFEPTENFGLALTKIISLKNPISFRVETCRHDLCIAYNFINDLQTDDNKVKKVKGLLSLLRLKQVTSLV